jgi:4-alpha-glucanotransferase
MDSIDTSALNHWQSIGSTRRYGISLPLYALHSRTSYGIGEYFELLKLFPWLKSMGYTILQLQPLNDAGDQPNPKLPLSPFALNPLFLSLTEIPHASNKEELYLQKSITYSSVRKFKETLLVKFFLDHGSLVFESDSFSRFKQENPWLDDYANAKGGKPEFHQFAQFLCFQQMDKVRAAAKEQGILLIGDLPSYLSSQSADVSLHPDWFERDDKGEDDDAAFTCPLKSMEKGPVLWWKNKLSTASRFYDLCKLNLSPSELQSDSVLSMLLESSQILPIVDAEDSNEAVNRLGLCTLHKHPSETPATPYSLTTLSEPTVQLASSQKKELIKSSHQTESLLHVNPLKTFLSLIPEMRWSDEQTNSSSNWSLCFKPSVEEIISNPSLREAMQECIPNRID